VPVQVLQVVGSQDVDVATAADPGVVDDAFGVATLEQALQSLQPVTRLCPMFDKVGEGAGCQDGATEKCFQIPRYRSLPH